MIPAVTNFIANQLRNFSTNPVVTQMSQSTTTSLLTETTMKAIGRPGFILIDNKIDDKTKRYAAMKEFLYQFTCLAVYTALVVPIFKFGAFKFARNKMFKNNSGIKQFENLKQFKSYYKLATEDRMVVRRTSIMKGKEQGKNVLTPAMVDYLEHTAAPEKFDGLKGAIEFGSLIGSVFGLAILAPQISHYTVHPVMKFLGFEKAEKNPADKTALAPKAVK